MSIKISDQPTVELSLEEQKFVGEMAQLVAESFFYRGTELYHDDPKVIAKTRSVSTPEEVVEILGGPIPTLRSIVAAGAAPPCIQMMAKVGSLD